MWNLKNSGRPKRKPKVLTKPKPELIPKLIPNQGLIQKTKLIPKKKPKPKPKVLT